MYNQENEDDVIDLFSLVYSLWQHALVILMSVILFGAVAFGYAKYMVSPLYRAETLIYVNKSISYGGVSLNFSSGAISSGKEYVSLYTVILKSRMNLEAVISKANLNYSYEQLKNMISVSTVNGTEVLNIAVTSTDPEEAELIANTVAQLLPKQVSNIVEGSAVKIIDYAVVPNYKISPSITKYTSLGMLFGLIASCGIVLVIELMNNTIRDEEYLINTYGLPIMATIPDLTGGARGKSRGYHYYGYGKKYYKRGDRYGK